MMMKKQQGFTLLEILISLSLGVFLLWGILQVFESNSKTARFSDSMSEMQERGRFAIEQLTKAIRLTGHQGCADPDGENRVTLANNTGGGATQPNTGGDFNITAIRGWEYTGSWNPTPLSSDINGYSITPLNNTDVIALQYGLPGITIDTFTNGASDIVTMLDGSDLSEGFPFADGNNGNGLSYGILADCNQADFVEVQNVDDTSTPPTATLSNTSATYAADALLMPFRSVVFYIANSPARNAMGNFIPSLYMTEYDGTSTGNTEELISGVDNLQITYGEQLSTGNIRFVNAATALLNMDNVVMVKIGLLMVGDKRVLTGDDTSSFTMPGVTLGNGSGYTNDRQLRRSFTTTVKLRNRI
jgi:type IV pilus assembly protein PilW